MTTPNKTPLPENYIQNILETYADGLEKHKNDSKALLVALLKASDKFGKRINSLEDYKNLQETVSQMESDGNFSGFQKLGLKQLKEFITKEYPQYGQQWLKQKHNTEKQELSEKQKKEQNVFDGLFDNTNKTIELNGNLQASWIDDLLQNNPKLAPESVTQLNNIKKLAIDNPENPIHPGRLSIKKNLVCIDGYTLPTKTTTQKYDEMKKNPEGLTYPGYAKALLEFAADITGKTFTFPANRDKLQKGEINGKVFIEEINTDANKAIIQTLHSILGLNSIIPVGLDKDGYVIYAVVRSVSCDFSRHSYYVPSALCPQHR